MEVLADVHHEPEDLMRRIDDCIDGGAHLTGRETDEIRRMLISVVQSYTYLTEKRVPAAHFLTAAASKNVRAAPG